MLSCCKNQQCLGILQLDVDPSFSFGFTVMNNVVTLNCHLRLNLCPSKRNFHFEQDATLHSWQQQDKQKLILHSSA